MAERQARLGRDLARMDRAREDAGQAAGRRHEELMARLDRIADALEKLATVVSR